MKQYTIRGKEINGAAAGVHCAECADGRKWKSVSEKPAEGAEIIVARITDGYRRWWKGAYIHGEFVTVDRDGEMNPFDATHWMAVPFPACAFDSLNPPGAVQTC